MTKEAGRVGVGEGEEEVVVKEEDLVWIKVHPLHPLGGALRIRPD